jgi:hypothetical protein
MFSHDENAQTEGINGISPEIPIYGPAFKFWEVRHVECSTTVCLWSSSVSSRVSLSAVVFSGKVQ